MKTSHLRSRAWYRTLPDGLDTRLAPGGSGLSAGEAQLLVFDDLSSALDVETERVLWERLFARMRNNPQTAPTCLVVSHRRAALQRADQIVVLKNGRVEAEGKLDRLLEECKEMQRLWKGDLIREEKSE